MVKNLPVMQEMRVRSVGREDHLEKGMATQLQYSCLENSMDREAWRATAHGVTKSQIRLSKQHLHAFLEARGGKKVNQKGPQLTG